MATKFTGIEGSTVSLKDTVEGFRMIADGELDHVPEQAFFNCGGIDDVMKAYERIKKDLG
jgi:F-type H+-transporting ATPase subunit beta